jgi:hypothetical protein
MQDNLFIENLKQSTGMRILLFLIILLISSLIGVAIAAVFMFFGDNGLRIAQGLSSIFMFVVPPIVYYYITRKTNQMQALGFRKMKRPWLFLIVGLFLMFLALPVTEQLTHWNEAMKLGPAFSRLEEYMKMLEESTEAALEKMLNADTFGGLLLNLLIIALIPAVGEELTFRGVLQQSLTRKMNPHLAIILSAAIFSFIHFQFYGFLPRMFLGMLLGYMFYISGSLWPSILMHFVNNGTVVVLYYLNNKGIINVDMENFFGESMNVLLVIACAVSITWLIVWTWIKAKLEQPTEATPIAPPTGND